MEGYNPAHDVCRLIINAAVRIAHRRAKRQIINRDFLLIGRHHLSATGSGMALQLNEIAFQQKLEAARNFPALQEEFQAVLSGDLLSFQNYPQLDRQALPDRNTLGSDAFRLEVLREVNDEDRGEEFLNLAPFYERYGELRVADGYYRDVIRYRQHIVPLIEALDRFADNC